MSLRLIALCSDYDVAEKNFENRGDQDTSAALSKAKKALQDFVLTAQREVVRIERGEPPLNASCVLPTYYHTEQLRQKQELSNDLAFFASWYALRGGWHW